MCLVYLDESIPVPKTGWKVFLDLRPTDPDKFTSPFYDPFNNFKGYKRGKWYAAHSITISTDGYQCYESGFHIFTNKESAERFTRGFNSDSFYYQCHVLEVEFEDVLAKGMQFEGPCIVARRMRICV